MEGHTPSVMSFRKISAKQVRLCLRATIIILLTLYLHNAKRVLSFESKGLPPTQDGSEHSGLGCASIILLHYTKASLAWSAVILFGRKRRRAGMLLIFVVLFHAVYLRSSVQVDHGCRVHDDELAVGVSSTKVVGPGIVPWFDNYAPNHIKEGGIRISFRLHDPKDVPHPVKFAGVPGYLCNEGAALPPSLS